MTYRNLLLFVSILFVIGCASTPNRILVDNVDPNTQVTRIFEAYHASIDQQNSCFDNEQRRRSQGDCEGLLRESMQLYTAFPNNERVQLLNAFLFYHNGRQQQASFLLDQILQSKRSRPEAAILRSRIALEEGNHPFAKRLLLQQLRQNPVHAELHETLAAAYYLSDEFDNASGSLKRAEQFGAPKWRINFHRGLVFENQGKNDAACIQYMLSVKQKPSFLLSTSRILALSDVPLCAEFNPSLRRSS